MGVKRVKVVVVKHPNCGTSFVFKVPTGVNLEAGDYILCNTQMKPLEIGRCITPSFEIIEPQLTEFYGRTINQLQPIVGMLKPCMFMLDFSDKEE